MIDLARHGDVAALTLRHGKANALDLQLCRALEDALQRGAASPARALVLTGTGSIFSAGVDLKRLADGGSGYVREFLPAMESFFRALIAVEKPVVVAVNGHAIAGGAVIACGCDVRILARGNAGYGVPELEVGVPFPPAALQLVRLGFPAHLLAEAALRAKIWRGEECLTAGLVHEIVEPASLLERALEVAAKLAAVPRSAWRLTKRQLRADALAAVDRAGSVREEVLAAWCSEEVLGAVRAYVARTLRS
jgi:enoyl-CoA hydratase